MWEAFDNSIGRLPVRRIDFDDAEDRKLHDDIVQLAKGIEDSRTVKEVRSRLAAEGRIPANARQRPAAKPADRKADHLDRLVREHQERNRHPGARRRRVRSGLPAALPPAPA